LDGTQGITQRRTERLLLPVDRLHWLHRLWVKLCVEARSCDPRERGHWEDPNVDGRIILRWIFRKWEGVETGWSWFRIGTGGGHL
jgi:hypothetical protein